MIKGWRNWLALALRLGFGILLVAASVDKIIHPFGFAQAVENYRLIGEGLSRWVAVWLPYLELLIGLLLILGVWMDAAVLMNAFLMTAFFLLIVQAYLRRLDISCGCFVVGEASPIGAVKIVENVVFGSASIFLVWLVFQKDRSIQE